jgi:glutaredoxin
MYGTDRCPHCKNQKKLFGANFKQVDYVECEQNKIKCNLAKVDTYPTWINAQGQRVIGEQTPEQLATLSGCPLTAMTGANGNGTTGQ